MTQEEYYELLKERWEKVKDSSREQIKAYNEFARQLRHEMEK